MNISGPLKLPTCYPLMALLSRCGLPRRLKGTSLNDHILNAIDEEITRLRQARAILGDSNNGTGRRPGKRAASTPAATSKPRRKLSAKARKAIADAQHKRWAKVKSQKKAAKAPAGKKSTSPK